MSMYDLCQFDWLLYFIEGHYKDGIAGVACVPTRLKLTVGKLAVGDR